jgi:hypothetical protein
MFFRVYLIWRQSASLLLLWEFFTLILFGCA